MTGILFALGLLSGAFCAYVAYAGALFMLMCFATTSAIAYWLDLNLKGKVLAVVAMDIALIIGAEIPTAYWKSMHGFEKLVGWEVIRIEAVLAIAVTASMGAIFFMMGRIWPIRTETDHTNKHSGHSSSPSNVV